MKTIIAGSRTITDYNELLKAIDKIDWEITVVISGNARGVDRLGERWARENNIPLKKYYPDWDKYGKAGGFKRSEKMVWDAEALLALWDGKSNGTKHTITLAQNRGLLNYVHNVESEGCGNEKYR
jgi:hypothetical protein